MDFEIVSPDSRVVHSKYWVHFGFRKVDGEVKKDATVCRLCKSVLKFHKNTSGMKNHLRFIHPSEYQDIERQQPSTAIVTTPGPSDSQSSLFQFIKKKNVEKLPSSSKRAREITDSIVKWVARDLRPMSIVSDQGFLNLMDICEPKYTVPHRLTIENHMVKLYDTKRTILVEELKQAPSVNLTTDCWTSFATDAYITITSHWLNSKWEQKSFVLQTRELRESHNSENLANALKKCLEDFQVPLTSVKACTTDNASAAINSIRLLDGVTHIPCLAHTLNLAVQKGLQSGRDIAKIISRLKSTAAHFHTSSKDRYLLKDKQKLLGIAEHEVINDCKTRWNSTYDMMTRAMEQQPAISAVIMEKKLLHLELSAGDWSNVEDIVQVLRPFKVATQAISTEKFPCISATLPLIHQLMNATKTKENENQALSTLKTAIHNDLEKRYNQGSLRELLNIASMSDPRFKSLPHLAHHPGESYIEIKQQFKLKAAAECQVHNKCSLQNQKAGAEVNTAEEESPSPSKRSKTALHAMGSLFDDFFAEESHNEGAEDHSVIVGKEVDRYLSDERLAISKNPLEWWLNHQYVYPHCALLAKKLLGIPTTSVPSERVFSTAGNIVTKKRSSLSPANVDRLVFLAENSSL